MRTTLAELLERGGEYFTHWLIDSVKKFSKIGGSISFSPLEAQFSPYATADETLADMYRHLSENKQKQFVSVLEFILRDKSFKKEYRKAWGFIWSIATDIGIRNRYKHPNFQKARAVYHYHGSKNTDRYRRYMKSVEMKRKWRKEKRDRKDIIFAQNCSDKLKNIISNYLKSGAPSDLYPFSRYHHPDLSLSQILLNFVDNITDEIEHKAFCDCVAELSLDKEFLNNQQAADTIYNIIRALEINKAVFNLAEIVLDDSEVVSLDIIDLFKLLVGLRGNDATLLELFKKYIPKINQYYSSSTTLLKKLIELENNLDNVVSYIRKIADSINEYKNHYGLGDNDEEFIELKEIIFRKFKRNLKIIKVLKENNLSYLI